MPVLPRCQFYQDASSTKMPVLPRCQFYQDASSTKMPVPPRCPFHNTLKIIPLLSNAPYSLLPTPYSLLPTPYSLLPTQRFTKNLIILFSNHFRSKIL
ncbi:MAG: hypothetical protein F6J90_07235 [Moorea sp. SIOASIH]|uniref:hypothetical protein n=1 Tax=Moorena sp. SIOASIH TaxID=2607817 RepID=UPI0013B6B1A1|nr:hypothetical protein [Moorena sp. SIOASIH]NEO36129.1 hypothetical protein [Moorena sp. SIOASIH]